jgi:hypothetical protein
VKGQFVARSGRLSHPVTCPHSLAVRHLYCHRQHSLAERTRKSGRVKAHRGQSIIGVDALSGVHQVESSPDRFERFSLLPRIRAYDFFA